MRNIFCEDVAFKKEDIISFINLFEKRGELLYGGTRNAVKLFEINL